MPSEQLDQHLPRTRASNAILTYIPFSACLKYAARGSESNSGLKESKDRHQSTIFLVKIFYADEIIFYKQKLNTTHKRDCPHISLSMPLSHQPLYRPKTPYKFIVFCCRGLISHHHFTQLPAIKSSNFISGQMPTIIQVNALYVNRKCT